MKDTTGLIRSAGAHKGLTAKPATTVNSPVYSGSTVMFANCADLLLANSEKYDGITYGTDRLPTQRDFEEALRNREEYSRPADSKYYDKMIIRLNIGLEDAADLLQDLATGFDFLK